MPTPSALHTSLLMACISAPVLLSSCSGDAHSRDRNGGTVAEGYISGTVTGPQGPEAGVWVIAETGDLPTNFVKIVVTDEEGRYVLPELPDASFDIWVRGYGLVDSPKTRAEPGAVLDLEAVTAPSEREAAEYYPAGYWFSLIEVPEPDEFPGTGPDGNGISPDLGSQAEWLRLVKSGDCMACHQLGNKATRELPEVLHDYPSSEQAWDRRLRSGQAGGNMLMGLNQLGPGRAIELFADWTDRIEAGAPPPAPRRPEGVERNVVITLWDWADPTVYLHDLVSTDRRDPTVNAYGAIYGALEHSADYLPVLDPVQHTASRVPTTARDPETQPRYSPDMPAPSIYWGEEPNWSSQTNVHNPMFDGHGRVWITAALPPPPNPAICKAG
jgi:hypothetical protein